MFEIEAEPYPHFATFDGNVIELWLHMPDKGSMRWHMRHVRGAAIQVDKKGHHQVMIELDKVGSRGFLIAPQSVAAAEQFVAAIRSEIARRGIFPLAQYPRSTYLGIRPTTPGRANRLPTGACVLCPVGFQPFCKS